MIKNYEKMADKINQSALILLGCGKMGSAMLKGWLDYGVEKEKIFIIEPFPSEWLKNLANEGLNLNTTLPKKCTVCILAVKPQMMTDSVSQILQYKDTETIYLSIAAGIKIATLETLLGYKTPIIRAMPNTPSSIGKGITAITGNQYVFDQDFFLIQDLLSVIGKYVRIEVEAQMDAVTAVSGSGPAYVFHFIETLAAAGIKEGLPESLAMELAISTIAGAGALAELSEETPEQLRINVTSPGGTTAAALEVLMNTESGFPTLMNNAIKAATERSKELSKT